MSALTEKLERLHAMRAYWDERTGAEATLYQRLMKAGRNVAAIGKRMEVCASKRDAIQAEIDALAEASR